MTLTFSFEHNIKYMKSSKNVDIHNVFMIEVDGLRMEKTIKDRIARWQLRFSSFDCIYLYTRCSKRSCNPLWLKGQRQSHKRLKHQGVTFVIYPLKLKKNICADLTWLFLSMAIEHAMAALPFR